MIHKQFSPKHKSPTDSMTSGIAGFIKTFEKNFPIGLNKTGATQSDQNLDCFIPAANIFTRPKAVGLCKSLMDSLISRKGYEALCEDTLSNKLSHTLDSLDVGTDSSIQFDLNYKPDLRKVNFLVNLYNIKNYILINVDPDRKVQKNLKFINYYEGLTMDNPSTGKQLKVDYIINRDRSNPSGKQGYIYLISQFEFSFITTKPLSLVLNIRQEIDEISKTVEYEISRIDLKVECVLQKIATDKIKPNDGSTGGDYDISKLAENLGNFVTLDFEYKVIDIDGLMGGNKLI
jgi:hypothetical protein